MSLDRRTLLGLLGSAAVAGCVPADRGNATGSSAVGSTSAATPHTTATSPAVPTPTMTPTLADALTPAEQAAQCLMIGADPRGALSPAVAEALAQGLGAVILIPATTRPATELATLVGEIRSAATHGCLVSVDQEGGLVQRLTGPGFTAMPSAAVQGTWTDGAVESAWRTWGAEMREAGIDVDLAPVVDVSPAEFASRNEPVALLGRGYGATPEAVQRAAAAAMTGLAASGVGACLKHFPGLGCVTGNTDFTAATDATTTLDSPLLAPFRMLHAKADMVMVSSATYTRIDSSTLAPFSRVIHDHIRALGFGGVIVSDDLGAAAALADVPVGERTTRFLSAGGDLVLTVEAAHFVEMRDAIVAMMGADPAFAAQIRTHAGRVLALKSRRGLL